MLAASAVACSGATDERRAAIQEAARDELEAKLAESARAGPATPASIPFGWVRGVHALSKDELLVDWGYSRFEPELGDLGPVTPEVRQRATAVAEEFVRGEETALDPTDEARARLAAHGFDGSLQADADSRTVRVGRVALEFSEIEVRAPRRR